MSKFVTRKAHVGINTFDEDIIKKLKEFFNIKIVKEMDIKESEFYLWKIVWFNIDDLNDVVFEIKIISDLRLYNRRTVSPAFHIGLHVDSVAKCYKKHVSIIKINDFKDSVKMGTLQKLNGLEYYYVIFNNEIYFQIINNQISY